MRSPMYQPVFTQAIYAQPEQRYKFPWVNEMPETASVKKTAAEHVELERGKRAAGSQVIEVGSCRGRQEVARAQHGS